MHGEFTSIAELRESLRTRPLIYEDLRTDLLGALRVEILAMAQTQSSYPSKNLGGWKSNEAALDSGPALRELHNAISSGVLFGCRAIGWAMVNRGGSEHPRHQHRLAAISGVYYVDIGDPAVPTIFETGAGELSVAPARGRLALFSGDTWHRVPRYDGTAPRITVAFDVSRGSIVSRAG